MSDEQTPRGTDEGRDDSGTSDEQTRRGVFEGYDNGEQPLQSYTILAGVFNMIFAVFLLLTKGTGRRLPERIATRDIVLLGVATHKLSTLIANDSVTSFIRAPFTELQEKESPKSVDEKPRGSGLRHSIGELVTCKFCMGQWIASFFTYGLVFSPAVTRLVASIFAIVTISDHLHQSYKALTKRA